MPTEDIADIAILTILPEEYQAVCQKLENLRPAAPRSSHANLYAWKVGSVTSGGGAYSVAVGMMGRAGTTESALATRDAVERWSPRYIFFVGVAGGLKSLGKGDVVIADVIHGYEYGKIEKSFTPRSNWTYKTDIGLLNGAVAHAASDWKAHITAKPPTPISLKAIPGEIASGDKVVDDPRNVFFAEVLKTWPKIIAVEMEGAGAGNAIEQTQALGKSVSYMMIRGISDLPRPPAAEPQADTTRGTEERDAWKAYAADTAAAFAVSFIAGGLPLPPR
jgi:nucleoside phosphorylase